MPKRAVTLLALALLAVGCGEEEDLSPSFEDRIPAGLELSVDERVLDLGEETTVRGSLERGGEQLSGQFVQLEQDPYPFDGDYRAASQTTTDEEGKFSFDVEPDANTAYRSTAGELSETQSKPGRVFVEPVTELEVVPVSGGTRFETTFRHPADRSIQGSSVFHYVTSAAEAEATGELPFARVTKIDQIRSGLSVASVAVAGPPGDLRYMSCIGYTAASGLGLPGSRCTQGSIAYEG